VDRDSHRELRVLEAVATNAHTTQRGLAAHLGIALGLTNLYLKRLVRKGYIKCVDLRANRVRYLLTPQGIAEKTRLTYAFMEYSLQVFREGRRHLKTMLQPYAEQPAVKIAIYGVGDAAELAYLCIKELGLEPAVIFDGQQGGLFLGTPIVDLAAHESVPYDVLIVATMESTTQALKLLLEAGVPRGKLVTLRDVPLEAVPSIN